VAEKLLWTCPKCGSAFVSRNLYHSCRRFDLDHPFEGKPPRIRRLFDRFRELVELNSPVRLIAYHDRVGFMVKVRFAGATPRRGWLDVGFWLTRRWTACVSEGSKRSRPERTSTSCASRRRVSSTAGSPGGSGRPTPEAAGST
jgi:hypothetical protein